MPINEQQDTLALTIDRHVSEIIASDGEDKEILLSMADHMDMFQTLMGISTSEEMNVLCERYNGFYRLSALLERLASAIDNGTVTAPE